jgi:hypothetical protein
LKPEHFQTGKVPPEAVVRYLRPIRELSTGRHTITTGNGIDTLSNNLIQQVCAGSVYSAQLGNSGGDAESEQLYFQMLIPADSLILAVKYAVLLQNAQHPPSKQPRFRYSITSSGIPLTGCTEKIDTSRRLLLYLFYIIRILIFYLGKQLQLT